ncbi:protein kinase domain-containing protein [Natronoglycomyces albus]|uniref:Protein kinase n=1 Tax=Natronoglycomyces albus TaxID=2811108 RepID=A0A895XJP3_9ACTN|nr:protein kinase [Natronoglycomyces albus]QSB05981.1 protein kinase [Natronoglycomyces albus]
MASPRSIGAVQIDRLLHRDPVSSVFSGTVDSDPTTSVCVTVAHERVDGSRREVFLEWAAKLTGVSTHQHIASFASIGLTEGAQPYLAVHATRRTLVDKLNEEGPLPDGQVRALGVALADALATLHERGLVHGSVQPANVLIGPGQLLQLSAFDNCAPVLARALPASAYTAPEHLDAAQAAEVAASPAADIYALSTLLYAALGGHLPWTAGSSRDGLTNPLLRAAPVPHISGTSQALTNLIGWGLHANPSARPTAQQLRQELTRLDFRGAALDTFTAGRRPTSVAGTLIPRTGLRPVTVAQNTDVALYERAEDSQLRPRLRKAATALAGVALTGAIVSGAALATYAATNPSAAPTCPETEQVARLVVQDIPDGDLVESWCTADGYVAATVDSPETDEPVAREPESYDVKTEIDETGQVALAWVIEDDELVPVLDCADLDLPDTIKKHLNC